VAAFLGHADASFTLRTYVHENTGGDVSALDNAYAAVTGFVTPGSREAESPEPTSGLDYRSDQDRLPRRLQTPGFSGCGAPDAVVRVGSTYCSTL
jgi:hypothetical protein